VRGGAADSMEMPSFARPPFRLNLYHCMRSNGSYPRPRWPGQPAGPTSLGSEPPCRVSTGSRGQGGQNDGNDGR
jgi:hypothetical protein